MKIHHIKGNSLVEYLVIFLLVMAFFILSIQVLGNYIATSITKDYLSGKKIRVSIKGIYTEKVGLYGGTKSQPVLYRKSADELSLDFGYLTLDNLPTNQPSLTSPGNTYGAQTLRYYSGLIKKLEFSISYSPLLKDKGLYLQQLGVLTFAMANFIDQITYYNGKSATLATPDTKISLEPVTLSFVDGFYTIKNYKLSNTSTFITLELKKDYYTIYKATGIAYVPVNRIDNGAPLFVWLINGQFNGETEPQTYTLSKSYQKYTALSKVLPLELRMLRPEVSESLLNPSVPEYYNLLKVYELYNTLYQRASEDNVTNNFLILINKEVNTILKGIRLAKNRNDNTIKVVFQPNEPLSENIVKKFYSNIKDLRKKPFKSIYPQK